MHVSRLEILIRGVVIAKRDNLASALNFFIIIYYCFIVGPNGGFFIGWLEG